MCCGNRVVVRREAAAATEWVVKHTDGTETVKPSEVSAKLAAARSPGATITQRQKS